jgi:hypothetical protein
LIVGRTFIAKRITDLCLADVSPRVSRRRCIMAAVTIATAVGPFAGFKTRTASKAED